MYTLSIRHPTSSAIFENRMKNIENADLQYLKTFFETAYDLNRYSPEEYAALSRNEQNACKTYLPYWCGAHFKETEDGICERKKTNITARNLLSYDIDYGDNDTWNNLLQKLRSLKINFFLHTSISHNPKIGQFKYRLVIPLEPSYRIETSQEYHLIFNRVCDLLGESPEAPGTIFDLKVSHDIARAIYSPTRLRTQSYDVVSEINGDFFPLQKDTLPLLHLAGKPTTPLTQKALPSEMSGLRGIYNRRYTTLHVLQCHGGEFSAPEHPEDPLNPNYRWYYTLGSSRNGIRFYEQGQWMHSDHDTDPLSIKLRDGYSRQWDAYSLYVELAHNGDETAAINVLTKDKKVLEFLGKDFEGLQPYAKEVTENRNVEFLTVEDIRQIRACTAPREVFDFILKRLYIMVQKNDIRFLVPIRHTTVKSVTNNITGTESFIETYEIDWVWLKRGDAGIDAYLGYSGHLPDPYNPKKLLTPSEYIIKHCPTAKQYTSFDFKPFNPYSEKSKALVEKQQSTMRLNTFSGFFVVPYFNYTADNEALATIRLFEDYVLRAVCGGDEASSVWLLDWLADIFQNPSERPPTALLLYSPGQGVGKGTLFNIMCYMLGAYAKMLSTQVISGNFNHMLAQCLLGCFDDIEWQLKKDAGKMRRFISEPLMTIEQKFQDSYQIKSCVRFMFTANHKNILEVDGTTGERRITMLHVKDIFPMANLSTLRTKRQCDEAITKNKIIDKQKSQYFTNLYHGCQKHSNSLLAWFLDRKITSDLHKKHTTELYNEVRQSGYSGVDAMLEYFRDCSWEQLLEMFNGTGDFGESEGIRDYKGFIWIKKVLILKYYKEHYAPTITTHQFGQQLRESKMMTLWDIDFRGRLRGVDCQQTFNGKTADALKIKKAFFTKIDDSNAQDEQRSTKDE